MREPCEGKLSSTVLRREGTRKGSDLSNTVGLNEGTIAKYIREQEKSDQIMDKITTKELENPFKGVVR